MKVHVLPPIPHPPTHLRNATGHLDPRYARDLRALGKASAGPADAAPIVDEDLRDDPLAEELGESFVRTATSGGEEEDLDQVVDEETGGPFVETTGEDEFAYGTDASNPEGAAREPFPVT